MKIANLLRQETLQIRFNDMKELTNFDYIKRGVSYYIKIEDKKYRFTEYLHIKEETKSFLFFFKWKELSEYQTGIFYNEDLQIYFLEDKIEDYIYEKTKKQIELAKQLLLK